MITIETSPKPGRPKNDDIAGHAGNVFWLMDGATQLAPPDHGLDAAWHVRALAHAFETALAAKPDIDLPALARTGIKNVADKFFTATGLTADAPQSLRPLSTLVLCRIAEDRSSLDYLVICDSTLAVIGPSGKTVITDARIDGTRPLAETTALLLSGKGFDSDDYKSAMRRVYDHCEKIMNKPDGFDVAGQDETVVDRALTDTIKLQPTDHVLLMSDGFTRAIDTLNLYASWEELFAALKTHGAAHVIDTIRTAEENDADGKKHPRSSRHDDATILWLSP